MAFIEDLRWSVGLWRRHPVLVATEGAFVILVAATSAAGGDAVPGLGWSVLGLVAQTLYIGWLGGQRVLMATVLAGRPVDLATIRRDSRDRIGPFFVLGALAGVIFLPVAVVVGLVLGFDALGTDPRAVVAVTLVAVVLDVVGTLMTPALALDTERVRVAVRVGWRLLRRHAVELRWHVLVPPLALVIVPGVVGSTPLVRAVVALVGWPLLLAVRGAVVAAYLRLPRDEVLSDAVTAVA